ncbi:Seryl-trna synthetase [Paramicrosporidium saccamoebae]|uniref:serine--tRNA ligase n=1 Tax=Paramicrosporidium saccamoebae TaxID=1246581 RepID=A0A2H9TLE2_9FUNG|nr:Seryl-trna synthetase [Paramicrosporidium saccamoebae]
MLDINLFRVDKGGKPELIKDSQRKRGASVELVDEIIELDKEWVKLRFVVDELNKEARQFQTLIAEKMKSKEDASELIEKRSAVVKQKEDATTAMAEKEKLRNVKLTTVGNIVHGSVVDSRDEKDNDLVRYHWKDGQEPKKLEGGLFHHQVLARLEGYDPERGSKVVGHRGYFLKNVGVRLNQALINYGMDFLAKRSYTLLQTPFMMLKEMMGRCAQLEDFDEQLYKVPGEEDRYLIATSEQPIASMHAEEWFEQPEKQLPILYAGYSTCFRKEAGSHGKDTWGIYRIHQFEKVEQFAICEPEKSWEMFDQMIGYSEEFYQSLGLQYRIVGIVSGALNNAAAKKYDLEAWFPVYGEYKELVSCSNCTDYQSRRLEIRCGLRKMGDREKRYVHCLNSTLTATERTLCCILENYQTPEGFTVPTVLRPYMGGVEFIPYTAPTPPNKN